MLQPSNRHLQQAKNMLQTNKGRTASLRELIPITSRRKEFKLYVNYKVVTYLFEKGYL